MNRNTDKKNNNNFTLNKNTKFFMQGKITKPVSHAFSIVLRDMSKVFGGEHNIKSAPNGCDILVKYKNDSEINIPETYSIQYIWDNSENKTKMVIEGADDLGVIYGLLHISTHFLGVEPFWFWAEKEPEKKEQISIPAENYISKPHFVKYRGWFINDEVCLLGWTDNFPPQEDVWQPVFEALLRCGGNMIIPGLEEPADEVMQWDLASEMGLYLTQHHASPMKAKMFSRAYPDKKASYDENRDLFEKLWTDAMDESKDKNYIWALGFRGQGDCPFWEQDKSYNTPEKRGELISRVIKKQHKLLKDRLGDVPCITYLYGEAMELYEQGFIEIPEDVIKIWSDNGFGKMVSRRQNNINPRIRALPSPGDKGQHGLYYHITFHDLQASNHLTMLPLEPEFVHSELKKAFDLNANKYLILNCGNIKPHIYFLDLVAEMWNKGDVCVEEHFSDFCKKYYSAVPEAVMECYREYFNATIQYGEHYDEKAGEEFYHHSVRQVIARWMQHGNEKTINDLLWATGDIPFTEQVKWLYDKCEPAIESWEKLLNKCNNVLEMLEGGEKDFFKDGILLQVKLNLSGCKGLMYLCRSALTYKEGNLPLAYVYASQAIWDFSKSQYDLKEAEHGKWENFYRYDWLTAVKSTIYCLEGLRKHIRIQGDAPDLFYWRWHYLLPETERVMYPEFINREPMEDDVLAEKLKEYFIKRNEF